MPPFGPIKRRALIKAPKQAGFEGPMSGSRHQFMLKGELTVFIPNPHRGDIGKDLLARLLRQARISPDQVGSIDRESGRVLVEEILEGGKDAFEMRRRKYGF